MTSDRPKPQFQVSAETDTETLAETLGETETCVNSFHYRYLRTVQLNIEFAGIKFDNFNMCNVQIFFHIYISQV